MDTYRAYISYGDNDSIWLHLLTKSDKKLFEKTPLPGYTYSSTYPFYMRITKEDSINWIFLVDGKELSNEDVLKCYKSGWPQEVYIKRGESYNPNSFKVTGNQTHDFESLYPSILMSQCKEGRWIPTKDKTIKDKYFDMMEITKEDFTSLYPKIEYISITRETVKDWVFELNEMVLTNEEVLTFMDCNHWPEGISWTKRDS